MAIAVSEANTISGEGYDGTLQQIIYEDSPLLMKLKNDKKIIQNGGRDIRWGIRYKKLGNTEWVDPREQVQYRAVETRTEAILEWTYIISQTLLSWDERVKNSGSKHQKINIIKEKTTELKEDFSDKLNSSLFAATEENGQMSSLHTIVDATTAYGGIAVADAADWAAGSDNTEATLSLYTTTDVSLADAVTASTFGKNKPDLHITTRALQDIYEAKLIGSVRYEDETMANLGFDNVTFKSKPVVADPACTALHWFGLDTSVLELHVHPDFNFMIKEWFELGQIGLNNAMVKVMSTALNLVSKRRNTHFKFTALAG